MKLTTIIFLLLISLHSFCQENSLFMTDSLTSVQKVKTRTKILLNSPNYPYVIDHYNEMGKLVKTETISPISDSPMLRTIYYYTNGQLDSSLLSKCGKYKSNSLIQNSFGESVAALMTTYKYNDDNVLIEANTQDDQSRVCFETFYSFNPYIYKIKWYSENKRVFKESISFFEYGKVPLKASVMLFDSTGTILNSYNYTYSNVYNEKRQLIQSEYKGPECRSHRKYSYYKNGLLKKKTKDQCEKNWSFSYTYY